MNSALGERLQGDVGGWHAGDALTARIWLQGSFPTIHDRPREKAGRCFRPELREGFFGARRQYGFDRGLILGVVGVQLFL